jgi:hypothetical protein
MALFPLPSAREVRITSHLRPAQVDAAYVNDSELDADIYSRIARKADFVEESILGAVSLAEWEGMTGDVARRRKQLAKDATHKFALASLFRSARRYADANEQEAKGKELLGVLTGALLKEFRGVDDTPEKAAPTPRSRLLPTVTRI